MTSGKSWSTWSMTASGASSPIRSVHSRNSRELRAQGPLGDLDVAVSHHDGARWHAAGKRNHLSEMTGIRFWHCESVAPGHALEVVPNLSASSSLRERYSCLLVYTASLTPAAASVSSDATAPGKARLSADVAFVVDEELGQHLVDVSLGALRAATLPRSSRAPKPTAERMAAKSACGLCW